MNARRVLNLVLTLLFLVKDFLTCLGLLSVPQLLINPAMLQPGASSRPTRASKPKGVTSQTAISQTGTPKSPRPAQREKRKQQGSSPETVTWAPLHKRPQQPQTLNRQTTLITQAVIDQNTARPAAGEDKGDLQYHGEIKWVTWATSNQHTMQVGMAMPGHRR